MISPPAGRRDRSTRDETHDGATTTDSQPVRTQLDADDPRLDAFLDAFVDLIVADLLAHPPEETE